MTQRSRMILFSSILLAACVVTTAVLWIMEGKGAAKNTATIVLSAGIILVSILSVVFIYLLKVTRRAEEKKLNESYFREYEFIKDAIKISPLSANLKRSITEDVLEMLLTAQANGKTVQAAIGNAESFAKEIISTCISKPRSIAVGILDGAIAFILFILFITTLLWLEDLSVGLFQQRIDLIMILFAAAVSFIIIPATRHLSLKKSAWTYFLPLAAGVAFIGIVELLRIFFANSSLVKALLDGSILMIPDVASLVALIVAMMIFVTVRLSIRRLPKLK
jgi:DNA-binding ferritin-like protein (Dps family)